MNQSPSIKRHKVITGGLILGVILLLALLIKGLTLNPMSVKSSLIDKPALDFAVEILQGEKWIHQSDPKLVQLKDFIGKPVVLNFWASWCVSCREEAKYFETFWQANRDKGIVVVGIAIQDTPEAAIEFAKTYGKTYPLALDNSGKAGIDYGVYGVPETFFIDRTGIIRHKETGPMSVELLEKQLALIQ
ncbi:MAG: TlpA disulfide reductase family protein [Proteobacteria bacterium]|nr:TlpA disulfide reductase family protein [Pseudomonadota bacterium]